MIQSPKEKQARYEHLVRTVHEIKPKRILEIGVYNGKHAKRMIDAALQYGPVEYYGFDLFEKPPEEEFCPKVPPALERVQNKLEKTRAKIFLFKGNTRETLPAACLPPMDLIFIDGGHSPETVKSDWECCKRLMHPGTVVIFDDYYNREDKGCKKVVDSISEPYEVRMLDPAYYAAESKTWIRFVKVRLQASTI